MLANITCQADGRTFIKPTYDPNSFAFITEELIERGFFEFAVYTDSGFSKFLKEYSPIISQRTQVVDERNLRKADVNRLFESIADQLEIDISNCDPSGKMNYQRNLIFEEKNFLKKQNLCCFAIAYENIYQFLLGMKYKTQVSFDLNKTQIALQALKNISISFDFRRLCSILTLVLNTYKRVKIPSLDLHYNTSDVTNSKFQFIEQLLDDELYYAYAEENYSLGKLDASWERVKGKAKKLVHSIMKKEAYRDFIDFGSKVVSHSSGLPLPVASHLDGIAEFENFLPPIIIWGDLLSSAKEQWQNSKRSNNEKTYTINIDHRKQFHYWKSVVSLNRSQNDTVVSTWNFNGTSKITGNGVRIRLEAHKEIPNEILQELRNHYESLDPIFCSHHNMQVKLSDLNIKYTNMAISVEFTPYCQFILGSVIDQLRLSHTT